MTAKKTTAPRTAVPDQGHFEEAAKLLSAAMSAYEHIDADDLPELVRAARRRVEEWFDAHQDLDPSDELYGTLGVLYLTEHAMVIPSDGFKNGNCDPIRSGIEVAHRLLLLGMRKPLDLPSPKSSPVLSVVS